MPRITFLPQNLTVECREGETVLEVGRRHDVPIETSCVGKATCGLCRVKIVEGEEHLNEFRPEEEKHLGNVYWLTKVRLSCQTVLEAEGEVTVELAPRRRRKKG